MTFRIFSVQQANAIWRDYDYLIIFWCRDASSRSNFKGFNKKSRKEGFTRMNAKQFGIMPELFALFYLCKCFIYLFIICNIFWGR